ncbi:hypothetical protein LJB89_04550 [Tyzzerella sp. OttesenSCG-928-J15]|nr:hypothetical protein [Tyzzerella sp. OttesenSCG-928-J15]
MKISSNDRTINNKGIYAYLDTDESVDNKISAILSSPECEDVLWVINNIISLRFIDGGELPFVTYKPFLEQYTNGNDDIRKGIDMTLSLLAGYDVNDLLAEVGKQEA